MTSYGITRRGLMKTGGAMALSALAMPAIIREARASSGSVDFIGWGGFDYGPIAAAFKDATGITMNVQSLQPDQETLITQAKLALQTGGVDIVEPTMSYVRTWFNEGLIQPYDMSKIKSDRFIDNAPGTMAGDQGEIEGQRYFLPSTWGTEALVFNKSEVDLQYGTASLGDLFDAKYEGMVTLRPQSALPAMGRLLEAQGKLPMPFLESYKNEENFRAVWDIALAELIEHKGNIAQFWGSETEAQGAFRSNGCVLGLCWDSTGGSLREDGFGYVSPKEGAFAWGQGYCLMKNARNVDQAHELVNWVNTPEGGSMWASLYTCNPTGKGALELMSPEVVNFNKAAFPGDAVDKLWWWPTREPWHIRLASEYGDKLRAA